MPVTTTSNHYKYQLQNGEINLSSDTLKRVLMRSGFVFNQKDHATLKNISTNTGAINLTFIAATSKITRSSGSFITDGFVVGNLCTTDSSNNHGPFTITYVSALEIVVAEALVDEGPTSYTLTSDDSLFAGESLPHFGYNVETLAAPTITEDDTLNVSDAVFATITSTAAAGDIGPSAGAIIYDDTTADNTIVCYIDFLIDQTSVDGEDFSMFEFTLREA